MIDSEVVMKMKSCNRFQVGMWKETEISNLQSVRANRLLIKDIRAEWVGDSVPFAKVSNKLICIASLTEGGVKKLSLKQGVKVIRIRPETKGFSDEQAEGKVKNTERPNPCLLHQIGMTCRWEWKAISTLVIAGFLRKLLR